MTTMQVSALFKLAEQRENLMIMVKVHGCTFGGTFIRVQ